MCGIFKRPIYWRWDVGIVRRRSILLLCTICLLFPSVSKAGLLSGINLKCQNQSLRIVLNSIASQSKCKVFYKESDINSDERISVDIRNSTLENALDRVLGRKYSYKIQNSHIIILPPVAVEKRVVPKEDKKRVQVSGTVTDSSGVSLPGVSVVCRGSGEGTVTGPDGKFKLLLSSVVKVLRFTYMGYKPQDVKIEDNRLINIVLKQFGQKLNEVVITGYQVMEKRKLSSSIVTVRGEDLDQGSALTVDKMLQGKVSGLAVFNNTSTPGAAPKIRVRGTSSISGNREPVWVVDGIILDDPVPITAEELNNPDNINLIGNAISSINPEDIDRIDILKDASATAIYGVKAANGVIVITTKKGKRGAPSVHYSTTLSLDTPPSYDILHLMNSQERIGVSKEIYQRGLVYNMAPASVAYEGALYNLFQKNITQDQFASNVKGMEEMNTNWFDILFRTAFTQKHSVSISGANDKTNYYFSGGYSNSQATVKGSGVKNYNAMTKLSFQLNPKMNLELQLRGAYNDKEYLHSSVDAYEYAYNTSRAIPCYDNQGNEVFYNKTASDEGILTYNVKNEIENSGHTVKMQTFNFNANFNYKLYSWLTYNAVIGVNTSNTNDESWTNDKTYYIASLRGTDLADWNPFDENMKKNSTMPFGGIYQSNNTRSLSYTVRNTLAYRKAFNEKHDISGIVGTEVRSSKYDGLYSYQGGYLPDRGKNFVKIDPDEYPQYKEWLLSNPDKITDQLSNFISYYATFTYSYDDRYSLNANVRADGSNKFGQDPKYRFLPVWSVSSRWNIHNESWFAANENINTLALRMSYGVQGNVSADQTPNLIVKEGTMDGTSHEYNSYLVRIPNPQLRWEKTEAYNLGLDFAFFKNRLSGTFELYKKLGSDQIIVRKVDTTTGMRSVSMNGGDLENKGWEAALNGDVIRSKNFTWSLSANIYRNTNKVTRSGLSSEYSYNDYLSGNLIQDGKAVGSFYAYQFGGLDNKGCPIILNIDEKAGMTKDQMYAQVFKYIGNREPDLNGGFSSDFRYRSWSLNLFFSFSLGSKVWLNNLYSSSGQKLPQPQQNMSDQFVDRWQNPGDEKYTNIPVLSDDALLIKYFGAGGRQVNIGDNLWAMYNKSDLRVASGDFLRLRNVVIRHMLSKSICNKLHVKQLNLRVEGSNLFLVADRKLHGQDPEQVSFGTGTVPLTPGYTLGLDIIF